MSPPHDSGVFTRLTRHVAPGRRQSAAGAHEARAHRAAASLAGQFGRSRARQSYHARTDFEDVRSARPGASRHRTGAPEHEHRIPTADPSSSRQNGMDVSHRHRRQVHRGAPQALIHRPGFGACPHSTRPPRRDWWRSLAGRSPTPRKRTSPVDVAPSWVDDGRPAVASVARAGVPQLSDGASAESRVARADSIGARKRSPC